jgi:hypothetical protein
LIEPGQKLLMRRNGYKSLVKVAPRISKAPS